MLSKERGGLQKSAGFCRDLSLDRGHHAKVKSSEPRNHCFGGPPDTTPGQSKNFPTMNPDAHFCRLHPLPRDRACAHNKQFLLPLTSFDWCACPCQALGMKWDSYFPLKPRARLLKQPPSLRCLPAKDNNHSSQHCSSAQ